MAGNGLQIKLGLDSSGFTKGLSNAMSKLGQFGAQVAKAALVAAPLAATGAAIAGAFRGMTLAADMEQISTAFKVLIGDAGRANALLKQLSEYANTTPFRQEEIMSGARSLLAAGFAAEDVAQKLAMLGDLAAGSQQPIEELAQVFGKMKMGDVIQAEELNQLTDRGIPILTELADKLGVTVQAIKKMGEQGEITFSDLLAVMEKLTGEGGRFQGMVAKMGRTWNGMWSTAMDTIDAVLRSFAEPLMESLKPALQWATDVVSSWQDSARKFGHLVADVLTTIISLAKRGDLFAVAVDFLKLGIREAGNMLAAAVMTAVSSIPKVVGKMLDMVSASMQKMFSAQMIKGWSQMASGLGQAVAAGFYNTMGMPKSEKAANAKKDKMIGMGVTNIAAVMDDIRFRKVTKVADEMWDVMQAQWSEAIKTEVWDTTALRASLAERVNAAREEAALARKITQGVELTYNMMSGMPAEARKMGGLFKLTSDILVNNIRQLVSKIKSIGFGMIDSALQHSLTSVGGGNQGLLMAQQSQSGLIRRGNEFLAQIALNTSNLKDLETKPTYQ